MRDTSLENFLYRNNFLKYFVKYKYNWIIVNLDTKNHKFKKNDFKGCKFINFLNRGKLSSFMRKNKNSKCINFVEREFKNLYFFFLLNKYNFNIFEIKRYGDIREINYFFDSNLLNNLKKIFSLIFSILNILIYRILISTSFLKKINILFSSLKTNEKINSYEFKYYNSSTINYIFIKTFGILNFKFYKTAYQINARFIEEMEYFKSFEKSKIVFLDSCLNHTDRIKYDQSINYQSKKKYYDLLRDFFKKIQIELKKKITISVHPSSNLNEIKKNFLGFKCEKFNSKKLIRNSSLLLFHESSSIIDGLILKKKILNIHLNCMGNYFLFRNNLYVKALKCRSINLESGKKISKAFYSKLRKNYDNYLKKNIFITNKFKSINDLLDLM